MSNARPTAEQLHKKYQSALQAYARQLADLIRTQLGVKDIRMNYIGPVIGTHSGPDTIALFFMGSPR